MKLIGLLLNLAAITASVVANHHVPLELSPSDPTLVRYTNESLLVQCRSATPEVKLQWRSPKGEIIGEHRSRIHIEQSGPEQLNLVFSHISLADKGDWTCEHADGKSSAKSFNFIVYQKITFTEDSTTLTVREGENATILCEVRGEPQPNVTWNFNGQPITFGADNTKFRSLGDGLLINSVTQNDTGEYTCRAYQVNPIASDMQERTVLMKIEHKPFWANKSPELLKYAYLNGSTTIACEAVAEPPATFSWYLNKTHLQSDKKHYLIETDSYMSLLHIRRIDHKMFGNYLCRAHNSLGSIERVTTLALGTKPPPPSVLKLRGFNTNTFDVDVGSKRNSTKKDLMDPNGFRIEYMTDYEFKTNLGKWTNAKRKDFPFEDGATFLIGNLEQNTTYLMRAATKNLAGFSDWTKVEKFTTQGPAPSIASTLGFYNVQHLLFISLATLL